METPTIIVRLENGQLRMQSNVADKVAAVGMLELAKAAVMAHQQSAGPAIEAAPPGLAGHLLGAKANGRTG